MAQQRSGAQPAAPVDPEKLSDAGVADQLDHVAASAKSDRTKALLATAARRLRRGGSANASAIPLILDGTVRLVRDGKRVDLPGGTLVRDLPIALTKEEQDELTARRAIRPATYEELEQLGALEAPPSLAAAPSGTDPDAGDGAGDASGNTAPSGAEGEE